MLFDPDSVASRKLLADNLVKALSEAGFVKLQTLCYQEDTFVREVFGGIYLHVYTSIINGAVRSLGKDAIRLS